MRGKCFKCGLLVKFPYYVKNKFKYCKRCGCELKQFYANKGEEYLERKNTEKFK